MTESLYDVNVLLMGEPTNMIGVVLIYLLTFIEVMFIGIWGVCLSLLVIRRLLK